MKFLKKLFKKLLAFIKKYWWILLIVMIVFAPYFMPLLQSAWASISAGLSSMWSAAGPLLSKMVGAVGTFAKNHGWATTAAVGLGAVAVLSPSTAKSVVGRVADVAGSVAEGAGKVASSVGSTLLKNPLVWAGLGGFLLLRRRNA